MRKWRTLKEKTLPTLCQNRESSLKFTRIPLFIKAYSYFFKSKWGFSFNLVRDQANDPRIKSSTFNYSFNLETSNHDSRSRFIAPSNRNVSWRLNQRNLLYSFIVKIHTEDCTHIYTNTNWLFVTLFRDRVIYLLRKSCVQISGTPSGTSLPLISFSILEIIKSPIHQVQWPRRSLRFPRMLPKALGGQQAAVLPQVPWLETKPKQWSSSHHKKLRERFLWPNS